VLQQALAFCSHWWQAISERQRSCLLYTAIINVQSHLKMNLLLPHVPSRSCFFLEIFLKIEDVKEGVFLALRVFTGTLIETEARLSISALCP